MADLIKYSKIDADIVKYQSLTSELDVKDPSTVLKYGSNLRGIAEDVADELLKSTKRAAAGDVGESLSNLLSKIEDVKLVDPGSASPWRRTIMRVLPFTKPILDSFKKFQARYETVSETFERIKDDVRKIRLETMEGNSSLATMYETTLSYRDKLKELIEAGYYQLDLIKGEIDDQRIVSFRASLEQDLVTKEAQYNLLENTLANIIIMAKDAQWVCQKADRIVSIVIPNMKNQANMAIRAMKLRYYSGVFEGIDETANRLVTQTSEAVKEASVRLAEQISKEDIAIEPILQAVKTTYSAVEEMNKILKENNTKSREKIDELGRETKHLKNIIGEQCIFIKKTTE